MKNSYRPGQGQAVEYIEKLIKSGELAKNRKIPPVRELAAAADVSLVTMWKAVKALHEKGVLVRHKGRFFKIADSFSPSEKSRSPGPDAAKKRFAPNTLWEQTTRQIEQYILNGNFPPGSMLPPMKQMQRHYRISYATLRKSLETLATEGVIEVRHRGYAVPSIRADLATAKVAICRRGTGSGAQFFGKYDELIFKALEEQCSHRKIGLVSLHYALENGRLVTRKSEAKKPLSQIDSQEMLGYILLTVGHPTPTDVDMVKKLCTFKKPVAVLDRISDETFGRQVAVSPLVRVILLALTETPGIKVARYLLSLKHKNLAFFSPYHANRWSQARQRAIRSVVSAAGPAAQLHSFCIQQIPATDIQEKLGRGFASVLKAYEKTKKQTPVDISRDFDIALQELIKDKSRDVAIRAALKPLFEKALANKSITAWIAVNDPVALLAIDFLRSKNIKIGQEISVISFDNTIESLRYGLTSYDFNIAGGIASTFSHILRSDLIWRKRKLAITEPEGYIVERKSTGPARKRK